MLRRVGQVLAAPSLRARLQQPNTHYGCSPHSASDAVLTTNSRCKRPTGSINQHLLRPCKRAQQQKNRVCEVNKCKTPRVSRRGQAGSTTPRSEVVQSWPAGFLCESTGNSEATWAAQSKRSEQRRKQTCVWCYVLSATDQASRTVNIMGCPMCHQCGRKQPAERGAAASEVTRQ